MDDEAEVELVRYTVDYGGDDEVDETQAAHT
jgi:hypothetical protein